MQKMFVYYWLLVIVVVVGCTSKNTNPLDETFSKKDALKEFKIFKDILYSSHPSLTLYTSQKKLNQLFDSIANTITNEINTGELFSKYAYLINEIGCAHTVVEIPAKAYDSLLNRQYFFPYPVKLIDNKLLVNVINQDLPQGTEIKTINGKPIQEVMKGLMPFYTVEGFHREAQLKNAIEDFALNYFYKYGKQDEFKLGIKDTLGNNKTVIEQPIKLNQWNKMYNNALYYYDRIGVDYDLTVVDEKNYALLRIATFEYDGSEKQNAYENFCYNSFELLQNKKNIKNLIIDLRENMGGDLYNSFLLFSFITHKSFNEFDGVISKINKTKYTNYLTEGFTEEDAINEKLNEKFTLLTTNNEYKMADSFIRKWQPQNYNFNGNVYVVTNTKVASAASYFAVMVKNGGVGKIIGEETCGGNYSGNGFAGLSYTLPFSSIKLEFPYAHIVYSYKDKTNTGRGLIPNYIVPDTYATFKKNNDTQIDFILDSLILPN